jgi:CubicO group peptidase (beta-lactamase class C family)
VLSGLTFGGGNLLLPLHDIGRIGYLCLNQGCWDERQVVAEQWVEESLQRH